MSLNPNCLAGYLMSIVDGTTHGRSRNLGKKCTEEMLHEAMEIFLKGLKLTKKINRFFTNQWVNK